MQGLPAMQGKLEPTQGELFKVPLFDLVFAPQLIVNDSPFTVPLESPFLQSKVIFPQSPNASGAKSSDKKMREMKPLKTLVPLESMTPPLSPPIFSIGPPLEKLQKPISLESWGYSD